MNELNLEQQVEQFIKEKSLFSRENKLLLAVSGGVDSMVLWHILKSLEYSIAVAHCNFQLRDEESEYESQFVQKKAQLENVVVHFTCFDTISYSQTNKLSIQEAARNLRYNYFYSLCNKYNYDYIVTAHHFDDRIETMFINLLRGTGLKGLISIPVKNNRITRPLLFATRNEIVQYAKENKIEWCEDSSNYEDKYLRNKIRHYIVPIFLELKKEFYHIQSDNFYRWEQEMQLIEDYVNAEIQLFTENDKNYTYIKKSFFLNNKRLQNLLMYYLKKFGFIEEQINDLLTNNIQVGKYIHSDKYIILVDRDSWILKPKIENANFDEEIKLYENTHEVDFPIKLRLKIVDKKSLEHIPTKNSIACIDYEKLTFPLILRKWKKGDFFVPIGMKGKKKVSDFLKDIKISVGSKKDTYVIVNRNNIVWIVGHRVDERYKITDNTKKVYLIEKL